jgi:hypothetical protein
VSLNGGDFCRLVFQGVQAMHIADQRLDRRDQHMTVAAFLSSALFVGASAAWHLLRGNQSPAIRKRFSQCPSMAAIFAGWCFRVFRPCISPISAWTGATITAHDGGGISQQRAVRRRLGGLASAARQSVASDPPNSALLRNAATVMCSKR